MNIKTFKIMRKWYDKLVEWLCKFKTETYLHILMVIALAALIGRVALITGADRTLAACFAAFLAFCIGFLKEMYDNKTEGAFEASDVLANFIGALIFFFTFI